MADIKVINLERSAERREKFARLNRHIDYEFFKAVDGAGLSVESIAGSGLFDANLAYTPGAYGCALSHLRLWEEAIATDRVVTVAEDDAIFRSDFDVRQRAAIQSAPADWDIIIWGWNLDYVLSLSFMPGISPAIAYFDQEQMRSAIAAFQSFDARPNLLGLDKCWGIPAYSISPAGARKFKERCFPLKPLELTVPLTDIRLSNTGIDSAMNAIYGSTKSFVCFPPLVVTENDHSISTIQQVKRKGFLSRQAKSLKQSLRRVFPKAAGNRSRRPSK
ncbi:MAG TPA: glycosyltransferase family 25 protein [Noviherbaspirillum sp.]|nr:glycosyltransferase family 25 protein [Noviherbaspirillum sp.]